MIHTADSNLIIDTTQTIETWCVFEHHATMAEGQPPVIIMIGACRLVDVYRMIDGRTNSEWAGIFANGGSVLVRIIAIGDNRDEIARYASQHMRSFNPMPRCNLRGYNTKGTSRPIQDVQTGKIYTSQKDAADDLGLNQSAISRHLRGTLRHVGGKVFQYVSQGT